jgi:AraC-like DNA-binding protein
VRTCDWDGLTLYEVRTDYTPELNPGYSPNHVLCWTQRGRGPGEAPLHFFPALRDQAKSGPLDYHREYVAVEFTREFFASSCGGQLAEPANLPLLSANEPLLIQMMHAIWEESLEHPSGRNLYAQHIGAAVAAHIFKRCNGTPSMGRAPIRGLSARALRRVTDFIHEHLDGNLSLATLGRIAEMDIQRLVRKFRESTGVTPHQYVLRSRVEHAKHLLRQSSVPLSAVALSSGFADQSHFSKTFRRLSGVAPAVYRSGIDG